MATKQSSDTNKQGRKDQQQEANLGQKEARGKGEEIRTLKFGRKFREIQLRPPLPHSAISSRVEQGRARRPAHRLGEAVSPVGGKPYLASPLCGRRFCRALYFFSAPGPVLPLPTLIHFGLHFFRAANFAIVPMTWPSRIAHCASFCPVSQAQRAYSTEWERHSAELIIAYRPSPHPTYIDDTR
jgi:hypothetical protein